MDLNQAVVIPVAPTDDWQLQRNECVISLGRHWPLQSIKDQQFDGFADPQQCSGSLYIYFSGGFTSGQMSAIELRCDKCHLNINAKTHQCRIPAWDVKQLKLALARLMLVCARGNTTFPISYPGSHYLDGKTDLATYIPVWDTGFLTPNAQPICIGLFLPHKIGSWTDAEHEHGEPVSRRAFTNLTESSVLIITDLLHNSQMFEQRNKRTIGQ